MLIPCKDHSIHTHLWQEKGCVFMNDCPYHDSHDFDGLRERCYYCITTVEERATIQKITTQIRNVQLAQKKPTFSGTSNVYIVRKEKSNTVSGRVEVIPHKQKHTPNAIDRVHRHISTIANNHATQMAVGHYLQYLSQIIPPETFCTESELSLLRKRSPPVSPLPNVSTDQSTTQENEDTR
jgi:hypothetical protein